LYDHLEKEPKLEWLVEYYKRAGPVNIETPKWQHALQVLSEVAASFHCFSCADMSVSIYTGRAS
jgi:hypothetical protein